MAKKRVTLIVGTRPNFVKIAPLFKEMKRTNSIIPELIHTGQHYDILLSSVFFQDFEIPEPDINLEVGSHPPLSQVGCIMQRLEAVLIERRPDMTVVVGDVNSTIAGALCSRALNIPLAHVEAGLRSFDPTMIEEMNRIVTDRLSDLLFISEESGRRNLLREGISEDKIYFVGNIMIDSLVENLERAKSKKVSHKLGLKKRGYALITLHRPSSVDNRDTFLNILSSLKEIQKRLTVVYPIHPRAKKRVEEFGFNKIIEGMPHLMIIPPLGYIDFLSLMCDSLFVMTDSGGIQEETTFLNLPCLTLRRNTERPITCEIGTNIVVGLDMEAIVLEAFKIIDGCRKKGVIPEWWDGKTSSRIVKIIERFL